MLSTAWAVVLAALLGTLTGCSFACRDALVSTRFSPDGRFVAVVFYRDCGAVTPFTTEISVIRSGANAVSRGERGNILSMMDPGNSKESLERNGSIEVRLAWKSGQLLSISTPRKAFVGKRLDHVYNIQIEYSTFD